MQHISPLKDESSNRPPGSCRPSLSLIISKMHATTAHRPLLRCSLTNIPSSQEPKSGNEESIFLPASQRCIVGVYTTFVCLSLRQPLILPSTARLRTPFFLRPSCGKHKIGVCGEGKEEIVVLLGARRLVLGLGLRSECRGNGFRAAMVVNGRWNWNRRPA